MSIYTEPGLKVNFLNPNGRNATLLEEIRYEVGVKGSGEWLIVPEGYETDGATVPRYLWWFLPPWGTKASKAAIIHDYLIDIERAGDPFPWLEDRDMIDKELHTAMLAIGVPRWKAWVVYRGVRLLIFPRFFGLVP